MSESDLRTPEIDLSQYPERAVCKVMPSIDEDVREIEITDAESRGEHSFVPAAAVVEMPVHILVQLMPEISDRFEPALGAGLVKCKIVEQFEKESLIRIQLPALSGSNSVLIPKKALARPKP